MKLEVATRRIKAFGERFGQAPSGDRPPQALLLIQRFA